MQRFLYINVHSCYRLTVLVVTVQVTLMRTQTLDFSLVTEMH